MKLHRFLLGFFFFSAILNLSASDEKNAGDVSKLSSGEIASELGNILSLIEKNYPLFFKKISSEKEDELISRFVNSLGYGISYGKEKEEENSSGKPKIQTYPLVDILSNKVSYIRLDSFDDEQFKQFEEDLSALKNQQNKKIGIIIDLRQCRSHNIKNLSAILALLKPLAMDIPKNEDGGKKLPLILITGKNTVGDAEILASELFKSGKCLCIGTESAGKQFKTQKINLERGNCIEIPEVPEAFENADIKPFVPSIKIKGTQLDYKKISSEKESEKADPCISCASDILTGLSALDKR